MCTATAPSGMNQRLNTPDFSAVASIRNSCVVMVGALYTRTHEHITAWLSDIQSCGGSCRGDSTANEPINDRLRDDPAQGRPSAVDGSKHRRLRQSGCSDRRLTDCHDSTQYSRVRQSH